MCIGKVLQKAQFPETNEVNFLISIVYECLICLSWLVASSVSRVWAWAHIVVGGGNSDDYACFGNGHIFILLCCPCNGHGKFLH